MNTDDCYYLLILVWTKKIAPFSGNGGVPHAYFVNVNPIANQMQSCQCRQGVKCLSLP